MESTKQSNQFDGMQNISSLTERAIGNAMNTAKKSEFIQEFGICDTHGQYPTNMQDTSGVLRSYRPPGCPACLKLENAARLLGKSNIPKRFLSCDFDNYETSTDVQKKALHQCKSFAENFAIHRKNGACLLLCGRPGTGKNHLATAISKKLLSEGFSVLRVKASQYLDAYWAKSFEEREGWLNDIAKVDLIMIDEIGRSSNAKSAQDAFFRLIDARYEAQLPTMIATNMNRDELIEVLGEATYDRFRQGGSARITFDWESYRPNAAMQDSGDI